MNKCITIIIIFIFLLNSCKKNESKENTITDPKLIAHLDSMMSAIGINSYNDLLTGKLEGNFIISAYYSPYNASCLAGPIPFKINTQLSGNVVQDTANRDILINAGNLFINNLKIIPNNDNRYVVEANSANSNLLDNIYGNVNNIKLIKNDITILLSNFYMPKNIIITGVNCNTGSFPDHSLKPGFKVNWNIDNNNIYGVVLELRGKDINNIERYKHILLADNGYYIFSEYDLSDFPKDKNPLGININLIRGNFLVMKGTDNRKYNFLIFTSCSYYFRQ